MATKKTQYYGIKFPFTNNSDSGMFLDPNKTLKNKIESEMLHVILTPKGTRLRNPEFGTNLMKYIFEPSDSNTWEDVKTEIAECVAKYVGGIEMNDVEILTEEDDPNKIYLKLSYGITYGQYSENNTLVVNL